MNICTAPAAYSKMLLWASMKINLCPICNETSEMNKVPCVKCKCSSPAGLPLQRQPAVHGLQLPAAVCAALLRLPHHSQG